MPSSGRTGPDTRGNLVYRGTSRNFNAVMAPAARITVVEVDEIVEHGELDPEAVVTPRRFRAKNRAEAGGVHRVRVAEDAPMTADKERLDRAIIAMRVARELPPGACVNLGIGIPTLVSMFVDDESVVFYHSESGVLNCGPLADEGSEDIDLINAGGAIPATRARNGLLFVGGCFCHDSGRTRGRHRAGCAPGVGGGRPGQLDAARPWRRATSAEPWDLAAGAGKVIVAMEHNDRNGNPKVVQECNFPLTGRGCVSLVVTDVAVLELSQEGVVLREAAPGWTPEEVQAVTGAQLIIPDTVGEYEV